MVYVFLTDDPICEYRSFYDDPFCFSVRYSPAKTRDVETAHACLPSTNCVFMSKNGGHLLCPPAVIINNYYYCFYVVVGAP